MIDKQVSEYYFGNAPDLSNKTSKSHYVFSGLDESFDSKSRLNEMKKDKTKRNTGAISNKAGHYQLLNLKTYVRVRV